MSSEYLVKSHRISKEITSLLEGWVGFDILSRTISQFQDVDVYLVGGAVRNVILNINTSPKDFDFVLSGGRVDQFLESLRTYGVIAQGQFQSPRWSPFNQDLYCDLMDMDKWNTGLKKCKTISDVLSQFDFTGNAVAMDVRSHEFYDPIGGYKDLKENVLRATRVDFPDMPIRNDTTLTKMAIHWFRYLIYADKLQLNIEGNTHAWLKDNLVYLEQINVYCSEFNENHNKIITALNKQGWLSAKP